MPFMTAYRIFMVERGDDAALMKGKMNKDNVSASAERRLVSTRSIPPRERLIFALDVSSTDEAKKMVEKLGDSVLFYKIGLQLFMAGGYFELLEWLTARKKKVFADLKFYDVPQTVQLAVQALKGRNIEFVTVHGNDKIMKAAAANKNNVKILAVTVLTSMDAGDLRQMGYMGSVEDLVLSRAQQALELGCDGIIASGLEAARIREQLGPKLIIVCPGIRPVATVDDQKRTVDVRQAFLSGADYIVVGRPIKDAPDPREAAEGIQRTIAEVFG